MRYLLIIPAIYAACILVCGLCYLAALYRTNKRKANL